MASKDTNLLYRKKELETFETLAFGSVQHSAEEANMLHVSDPDIKLHCHLVTK